MVSKRYREKFTFWLDLTKNDEYEVAETISELKRKRKFAATIRDGIRLICDLRAGRLEVLFALFPWVKAEFMAEMMPKNTSPHDGFEVIMAQLEALREQLTPALQAGSVNRPPLLPADATRRRVLEFTEDDPDNTIVLNAAPAAASEDAAQNLFDSFMGMGM